MIIQKSMIPGYFEAWQYNDLEVYYGLGKTRSEAIDRVFEKLEWKEITNTYDR